METDLQLLIRYLLTEDARYGQVKIPASEDAQKNLFRSLMNVWTPKKLDPAFLTAQDSYLQAEVKRKGIIEGMSLPVSARDSRLALWQGDITRLRIDAIVNAANSQMLGCFVPLHRCIDNAIHSSAGLQLRAACHALMEQQGYPEPTGSAKITAAYNLPSAHILHTVGPIVQHLPTQENIDDLSSAYRSCLALCDVHALRSVAFCCISTGEFHFPNRQAAEIAVKTVTDYLNNEHTTIERVVFNVFQNQDDALYRELLG